jgi:MFS family permease
MTVAYPRRSTAEGVAFSVVILMVGSFTVIGASANAPAISEALGLTPVGVGAIASIAYLGALSTSGYAGRLTDARGPVPVIAAGLFLLAAGNAVAGLSPTAWIFYVGIYVCGLGYGAVNPATTVMSNPPDARRRALLMSIKQSGVPMGGILAGMVLPAVALAVGWRSAFVVSLGVCLPILVLLVLRRRSDIAFSTEGMDPHAISRRLRLPSGYLFGLLIAGVQVSIFAFTAVYLVEVRGSSPTDAGLGVSILLVGGVVGRLSWGWLSDAVMAHRITLLQVIAGLGAVALVALIVVPDALVLPVLVALGLCSVGWNGVYIAVIAESTAGDGVGSSTGSALSLINLGAIIVPLLVGWLVHLAGGWRAGLMTLAATSVLAMLWAGIASEPTGRGSGTEKEAHA